MGEIDALIAEARKLAEKSPGALKRNGPSLIGVGLRDQWMFSDSGDVICVSDDTVEAFVFARNHLLTFVAEIERLRTENAALRGALEWIRDYPNGPEHHHPDECELFTSPDDEFCSCGYWASSFPMLKIEAIKALKP